MTVEVHIEERKRGEVAAVPVFSEDVAADIEYEQLAGIPEMMVGQGSDAGHTVRESVENGKAAGVEWRLEGFDGGTDRAAETASPEHVATGVEAVEDVVGIGQFAGDEEFVGAVAIEVGLDGPGEIGARAEWGVGAGMKGPGGAALFIVGGDNAVVDGEVMERSGAEVPQHGGGSGEEGEQNGSGVDEIGRPGRGRGVSGAPGINFRRDGEDAAVGTGQAADGEGAGPFPELDGANGDAEVGGYFLPGLEFVGHRDRCGGLAVLPSAMKRNTACNAR